jgi:hypothetical protein
MKITRFKFWVLLTTPICVLTAFTVAAFIFLSGCEMFENHTDPLADPKAGWKRSDLSKVYKGTEPDAAITKDYEDYTHTLPPYSVSIYTQDFLYEDGTGRHAVKIGVAINGTWWQHVLIYDQNDKRIKVIKYISGHYAC